MKYLLDTNICIYLIKQKPLHVLQKFQLHPVNSIGLSSITVAELQYGVQKSQHQVKNQQALTQFLLPFTMVDFDNQAAITYGKIRATLEQKGMSIGPLDTLIAAQALSLDVTLVTNNAKEFMRIPNLTIENWADQ